MGLETTPRELRRTARIAGGAYLLTMATGIFAESYVRGSLIVSGSAAETAQNIIDSERLFRVGIAADLATFGGVIVLTWALYIVLRTVDERLALLALMLRLVEVAVHHVATLGSAGALRVLSGAGYLDAVPRPEREVLARLALAVQGAGINLGFILLGLGSAIFAVLFYRGRIVPRLLAGWGVAASLLLALSSAWYVVDPRIAPIRLPLMAPMFVYEVGVGALLLVTGGKWRDGGGEEPSLNVEEA